MYYLDLTHQITNNTPVYPGDKPILIEQTNSVEADGFSSHQIQLQTHIGTHIDAPAHMITRGKNLSDFPLSHFIGKAKIINAVGQAKIDDNLLFDLDISDVDILFIHTNRDKIYNSTEYFTNYPEITTSFAQKIVDAKIKIVGMDQASPDYQPFNTHKLLLNNDILIIENLTNLDLLINKKFTVFALPLNSVTEAAPVRVIASLEGE